MWASDGNEFQEPLSKTAPAPHASDEFMVMPSYTTAAEAGQTSPTPDITSQPRSPQINLEVYIWR